MYSELCTQRGIKVEPDKYPFSENRQFKISRNKALTFCFFKNTIFNYDTNVVFFGCLS